MNAPLITNRARRPIDWKNMKKTAAAAALMIASAAAADPLAGTQRHDVQHAFAVEPCASVIATIDATKPAPKGDPFEAMLIQSGEMAMYFGYLMGFEATHPNIAREGETILARLRTDCETDPTQTALHYLLSYSDE
jgi:hypothetical protein